MVTENGITPTREHAIKVVDLLQHGLSHGLGEPIPGKMCVEALVSHALGLPHSDDPGCVSPSLRRLKIGLNDRAWSSNHARAEGLKRLAVAQLGSKGAIDDAEFVRRVIDMTIRRAVPVGLRAAASVNPTFAERLEAAAVRCETEGTREACRFAQAEARAAAAYADAAAADASAASAAAYADAAAADASAASAAAYADAADADAAAASAAYAADAAADASAASAAYAADAAADADADAARARSRDRVLSQCAEWIVEILIDLKAPGCEWLDLVPIEVQS